MIIGINGYAGSGKDTVGTIIQYLTSKYKPCAIEDCLKANVDFSPYSNWEVKKWAGKLKQIANMLTGIPVEKFEDQEFKKTNMPHMWGGFMVIRKETPSTEEKVYNTYETKADAQNFIYATVKKFPEYYTKDSFYIDEQPMTVREFLQKLGTDALRRGLHTNTWVNALMADYEGLYDIDTDRTTWPNWIITDTRFPNEAQAIKNADGIIIRVDRPGIKPINNHPSEVGLDDWDFDYKIANVSDLAALEATVKNILEKENIL